MRLQQSGPCKQRRFRPDRNVFPFWIGKGMEQWSMSVGWIRKPIYELQIHCYAIDAIAQCYPMTMKYKPSKHEMLCCGLVHFILFYFPFQSESVNDDIDEIKRHIMRALVCLCVKNISRVTIKQNVNGIHENAPTPSPFTSDWRISFVSNLKISIYMANLMSLFTNDCQRRAHSTHTSVLVLIKKTETAGDSIECLLFNGDEVTIDGTEWIDNVTDDAEIFQFLLSFNVYLVRRGLRLTYSVRHTLTVPVRHRCVFVVNYHVQWTSCFTRSVAVIKVNLLLYQKL